PFGQYPTPCALPAVDRQAVEVVIGDLPAGGHLPASDVDFGDGPGVVLGRTPDLHYRRTRVRTAVPAWGGGKLDGRRRRSTRASKVIVQRRAAGARPPAHRAATWWGRTRSARTNWLVGWRRRRSIAVDTANGGLATTLNGRRG